MTIARHQSTKRQLALVAALVAVASACGDGPLSPELRSLKAAEARWAQQKPSTNSYLMEQQVGCFCGDRASFFEVTVTQGAVTRARNLETDVDVPADRLPSFRTVDQLFAEVRNAIEKPGTLTSLEFDAITGVPSTVGLDPIRQAADDEVTYFTRRVILMP
jgi:hypothetical protein